MPRHLENRARPLAAVLALALAGLASAQSAPGRLNDTGVGFGGDESRGNHADCSGVEIAQQDCAVGRDALARSGRLAKRGAGPAGFDFTRVCHSGEAAGSGACPAEPARGAGANDWGCTRDNVTGLVWELKTDAPGPRQRDATFTQFSAAYNPGRELGTGVDAAGYVAAVNAQRVCGAADWRVPTRLELLGIVHYGSAPPAAAVAAAFFPELPSKLTRSVFWSSSGAAGVPGHAWGVDFADGSAGDDNRSVYYALRLVRGAPPAAAEWRVSADGQEVSDGRTGLVWRRCAEGQTWSAGRCSGTPRRSTWREALQQAKAAASGGAAWRLPDIKELASLVDDARATPAIDPAAFPDTPALWFWSSTPDANDPAYSWFVNFGTGYSGHHGFRADRHALRLVRSAP